MAETHEKIMKMVEDEIRKNPDVTTDELMQKAAAIDESIAALEKRVFHARYPLQVRRRLAPPRERKPAARAARRTGAAKPARSRRRPAAAQAPEPAGTTADRSAIRSVLLDFARAVAAAEGKADVVDVIGGVDRYVDRVIKATSAR